ncbi:MAG: type II secretion system F family protein [Treponema sp.]|nr:type II secretion system F family protein [Treponema sp.]
MSISVQNRQLISFTENMSSLVQSGLSIIDSLKICAKIDDSKNNLLLCDSIIKEISNGKSFCNSLKDVSHSFSPLYISLIRIGEITGSIEVVLKKLTDYLKQKNEMKQKLWMALSYPLLVFFTALVVILVILFYVFPKLSAVFEALSESSNEFANISSRVLLSGKITCSFILILFAVIISGIIFYKKNQNFKNKLDNFLFSVPLIKDFLQLTCTYDFSFSMKLLCGSGMQIVNALEESKMIIKNTAYRDGIDYVKKEISDGKSLYESIKSQKVFPKYLSMWIGIGEANGNVQNVFEQIYEYYKNMSSRFIEKMTSNAESFFIIITGLIIFLMVVQFVLPIMNILGSV